MKCLICESWSVKLVCKNCAHEITITPHKRVSYDNFVVYSFFDYQSIEFLLKSKYSLIGSKIYALLAQKACEYFRSAVGAEFPHTFGIGLDDKVEHFYSHTGVIVHEFRHIFKPLFGALIAQNNVHYAGKSLEFRQNHKKDFIYRAKSGINAVIIDDIITTGLSMKEARQKLESCDVNVLFGLTLCDARF